VELLGKVGLAGARVDQRFACFRGTSKEAVAEKFGVRGVNVFAIKESGG